MLPQPFFNILILVWTLQKSPQIPHFGVCPTDAGLNITDNQTVRDFYDCVARPAFTDLRPGSNSQIQPVAVNKRPGRQKQRN